MKKNDQYTAKVDLPPATQIGVVVKDLDRAIEYYSKILGIGPFNIVFDFVPEKSWYMGESSPLHLRVGRAFWGAMDIELIQPMGGRSIHQDFLDSHGEGLHHLGIDVNNYDEIVQMMNQAGFKTIQSLEIFIPMQNSWAKAAYFDTHKIGGIIIEALWRPWLAKSTPQKY